MNNEHENKIILSGGTHDLDKFNDSAQIIIKGKTHVNAINLHNNMNLFFILEKDASLVLNLFDYALDLKTDITIQADDNSSFVVNAAFISEVKYELNIDTKLYGNNINGSLNVRGINELEGIVKVVMNGTVAGETKENVLSEYARIINKSNFSNILIPNLIVNTNEVEANHGVSVGHISEEQVFYLMSKGITRTTAIKMIEEGFILSIMSDDVKQKIQNILVGR